MKEREKWGKRKKQTTEEDGKLFKCVSSPDFVDLPFYPLEELFHFSIEINVPLCPPSHPPPLPSTSFLYTIFRNVLF
jgi:hypothetical protein